MNIYLAPSVVTLGLELCISGSKSETNRLLLLQAIYPQISVKNTSDSDDSQVMKNALSGNETTIDIHHAGTAMRFLTAYFSMQPNRQVTLTGSARMKQRPIKILVDALNQLGAEISYLENDGFPPIKIKGKELSGHAVSLPANVSSQYITALLLIAPKLENGLSLTLEGNITSIPYINMTLNLLDAIGVDSIFENNVIHVKPLKTRVESCRLTVESDWSSASYFYSIIALSALGTELKLSHYNWNSLQGDRALVEFYQHFGVETTFLEKHIVLTKRTLNVNTLSFKNLNLNHTPDLAQTLIVTCFALGIECHLKGLHTLKIKETDRLEALKIELTKLGATVSITDDSFSMTASASIKSNVSISTYNDHRMAMAFAPLALKVAIEIENAHVVSKSYPAFWSDLKKIGIQFSESQ